PEVELVVVGHVGHRTPQCGVVDILHRKLLRLTRSRQGGWPCRVSVVIGSPLDPVRFRRSACRCAGGTCGRHGGQLHSVFECSRRAGQPMAATRLAGRRSVQWVSMYSRQAARVSVPWTWCQPVGISANDGHSECWFSSLTRTRKTPFSSSNGLPMTLSP